MIVTGDGIALKGVAYPDHLILLRCWLLSSPTRHGDTYKEEQPMESMQCIQREQLAKSDQGGHMFLESGNYKQVH